MTIPILASVTEWYCPNCKRTKQTRQAAKHLVTHQCPKLAGITVPYVRAGIKAKVTAREREDYVGNDLVTVDENRRPVMSVVTERETGQDALVFAPVARGGRR